MARITGYLLGMSGRRWVFLALALIAAGMAVAGVVVPATGYTLFHTGGPSLYITHSYWTDVVGIDSAGDNWPVNGGKFVVIPAFLSGFLFLLTLRSDDGLLRGCFAANGLFLLFAYWWVDIPTDPIDSGLSRLSPGLGQVLVPVAGGLSLATALSHVGYNEWQRAR